MLARSAGNRKAMPPVRLALAVVLVLFVGNSSQAVVNAGDYFLISVVDEATDRGVPLVELKTTANVRYFTDSAGLIACDDPALLGQTIYFEIRSDGYEVPRDGFGFRGKPLSVVAGGSATIKLKRTNIAERLYRVTGEGIYRDTVLAGRKPPIAHPLLNAQVTGQDTVMMCRYRDKLYWFWGDTNRQSYPLGNFAAAGATSELPRYGGLDPAVGVDLNYFTAPTGFAKPMVDIPGDGPKWLFGLMTLPDESGHERLVACYRRMKSLNEIVETGLVAFDDDAQQFKKLVEFPRELEVAPDARPIRVRADGIDYFYFFTQSTLPSIRVKAEWRKIQQPSTYEAFTCLLSGSKTAVDRDADGKIRYRWKPDALPLTRSLERSLIQEGKLKPEEGPWQLRDVDTDQPIDVKFGSVCWNAYRQCWIAIMERPTGSVYYAEADTPTGPWVYAKRVAQHEHYTFYWPAQHPELDADGGREIFFEGTYTAEFSDAPMKTPRYDYNQLMYRLHLDDPRLALPAPVYQLKSGGLMQRAGVRDWSDVVGIMGFAVPSAAIRMPQASTRRN